MSGRIRHVVAVVGVVLSLISTPVGATPAHVAAPAQSADGLDVAGTTTYRLDEAAGAVHVTVQVSITHTKAPEFLPYGTRSYYFDRYAVPALGPVVNARATRDGAPLTTSIETAGATVDAVVVNLSPALTYGNTQELVVEFELPTQPNGSDAATRVNAAFATWYVAAVGDSGAATVVIDVPERFELEAVVSADVDEESAGGRSIYRFADLDEADAFFGVSARDDAALVKRTTSVGDDSFEVQAWPGDEAWADFVLAAIDDGIPALTDWVGLDIDGEREIVVAESATPYLYGYAGWYSPADGRVEIGDDQDLHTILHELAHIWYHGELFTSRWVTEGLAELAANRAATAMGEEPLAIEPLDATRDGALPLSQWDDAAPSAESTADDPYGYQTAYALLAAIVDTVGDDELRSVVARADADELPLAHDDGATARVTDDRYFYDLLLTTPGVEPTPIEELFDVYVWTDADRAAVAERRAAMDAYDLLVAAGDGWAAPLVVRSQIAAWRFDGLGPHVAAATDVLDARERLEAELAAIGLEATSVRAAYEQAGSTRALERLLESLPDVTAAARRLTAAHDRVDSVSTVERLGLVGRDLDGRIADADVAFAAGDLEEMHRLVDGVDAAFDQAPETTAAILLVGAGWVASVTLGLRRRGRRGRVQPAS